MIYVVVTVDNEYPAEIGNLCGVYSTLKAAHIAIDAQEKEEARLRGIARAYHEKAEKLFPSNPPPMITEVTKDGVTKRSIVRHILTSQELHERYEKVIQTLGPVPSSPREIYRIIQLQADEWNPQQSPFLGDYRT